MNRSVTPHLILGGARSGKSTHAEALMQAFPPPYRYVATAEVLDDEMARRVADHQSRRGASWRTVECPLALPETLERLDAEPAPILVECLTLWYANVLLRSGESAARTSVLALCDVLSSVSSPVLLVSNEVGCGIVPENALARSYRDLAGWANQHVAKVCRAVTYVVAGIPFVLKPR